MGYCNRRNLTYINDIISIGTNNVDTNTYDNKYNKNSNHNFIIDTGNNDNVNNSSTINNKINYINNDYTNTDL